MTRLLEVRGLSVTYAGAPAPALADLDLELDEGGSLAVVGESGAGKSTLLLVLLGLLPRGARVERGSIVFRGVELVGAPADVWRGVRGRAIGVVFQDALAAFDPVVTVGAQVAEALGHLPTRERPERVRELLARCRLPDPDAAARAHPHALSGGMRQRALVAAVLAGEPALLCADEPTSALDPTLALAVLDLLDEERARRGSALLVVTHDLVLARERCDRVVVLRAGRVVESGPTRAVFARPAHPYTAQLVAARAALAQPGSSAPSASLSEFPRSFAGGCALATHCPLARARCGESAPPLAELRGDHERRSACFFAEEVSP